MIRIKDLKKLYYIAKKENKKYIFIIVKLRFLKQISKILNSKVLCIIKRKLLLK